MPFSLSVARVNRGRVVAGAGALDEAQALVAGLPEQCLEPGERVEVNVGAVALEIVFREVAFVRASEDAGQLPAYGLRINQKTNRPTALFPLTPSPRLCDNVNATPQPPSNPWKVSLSRAACPLVALVSAWSWDGGRMLVGCWWDAGGTKEVLCLPLVVP